MWVSLPAGNAVPPELPLAPLFRLLQPNGPLLFMSLHKVDSFVRFRHLTKMHNFIAPVITDMKPRIMKSMTLARHESEGSCVCACVCVCVRQRQDDV